MVMSWIFTGILVISLVFSFLNGNAGTLAAAIPQGAQAGITLAISIAGSICLWSGVGKLLEETGISAFLARCLSPILSRLFPSTKQDKKLAGFLSNNICANLLGLGNAATPMGIQAAIRLKDPNTPELAGPELCRLIVLNTASIQLIPANVAAIRASLGAAAPFDILPAVWITSFTSAGIGLLAAFILGKLWRHG